MREWQHLSAYFLNTTRILFELRCENRSSGFPTRSDTNRVLHPQKVAGGLEFRIKEVEGLHNPRGIVQSV